MRLLWVSHKAEFGGAELALAEGVRALAAGGHEVHGVLPREGPLRERLDGSAEIHVCNHNPWTGQGCGPATTRRWSAYNLRRGAPEIAAVARRIRGDLVVTNTITVPAGAIAARRAKLAHAWFLH